MSKKLDSDFKFSRYGIDARLVQVDDAEFILGLRTNEKLSRHIHATSNDIEQQKSWMRSYKEREAKGEDYYFIYSFNGCDFAVNRIYDINTARGTGGSWLCQQGTEVEHSMATLLIMRDILFEVLDLDYDVFDVRKNNKIVQKTHLLLGAKKIGETELDYLYSLSKEDYQNKKQNIIQLLNLPTH